MKIAHIPCEEAALNVEKSFWQRLTFIDRIKTRWHMFLCKKCSEYEKKSTILHRLLCSSMKKKEIETLTDRDKIRLKQSLKTD